MAENPANLLNSCLLCLPGEKVAVR